MKDKVYVRKLPTIKQLQARTRSAIPVKQVAVPIEDYKIAIKLFDMAHGFQVDRLDEFCIVNREDHRDLLRQTR